MKIAALALLTSLIAAAAQAQTYVPGQAQQNVDRFQLQLQSQQIQQLQRQNTQALQQPDPGVRLQAQARQVELQHQADENVALQQQALSPHADPNSLNARLQANSARVEHLQQQPPILPAP